MRSELDKDFRKKARNFKGRIDLMKKIPINNSISIFFELCNFNINNYLNIEKERFPNKLFKEIVFEMHNRRI